MLDPERLLSHPVAAVGLRVLLGGYIVYMARIFYASPLAYFRKSAPALIDLPWLGPLVRLLACFCLWGGCFIVAAAIAVQIFALHGNTLAVSLFLIAALAAWLLLPRRSAGETQP
jgi:hypothetical protein